MEYRIIPMETYPRRAHFAYFSTNYVTVYT